MNCKLNLDLDKGWHCLKQKEYTLLFKGYLNNMTCNRLLDILKKNKFDSHKNIQLFKKLDGHFSLIFFSKKSFLVLSDRICSIPLILKKVENGFVIADNYHNLLGGLKKNSNLDLDYVQITNVAMSGYTFGETSLYKNIYTTHAGIFYICKYQKLERIKYYDWKPFLKKRTNYKSLKSRLEDTNEKIIKKLIKSCKQRCIAVPLSAGYDSRFILSGLIKYGYKNIFAFSYGRKNNREKLIAKKLTSFLKIPWVYIEFNNKKLKKTMLSKEYREFKKYSDVAKSVHFPQDFFAIQYLKKNKLIPDDSIIINGQTGDFISGNHIQFNNKYKSFDKLLDCFLLKNFRMSNKLLYERKEEVKQQLKKRIFSYNINIRSTTDIYEALEKIEYEDRQSKYVIAGQRAYEYFGYEWRLPLWDKEYISFWEKVSIQFKIEQSLYKKVLVEQNWANIWKNFELNPKNSFPTEILLLRFLFKGIFLIFGKDKWHKFELKFLDYFMTPLCGYSPWSYIKVILDNRGFSSALSWHIEEYLKEKGVNWNMI